MHYLKINKCRICNNKKLFKYLDLGNQPLANSFLKKSEILYEKKFPLQLLLCNRCFLSQLSVTVNPELIFSDYDYLSSSSKALQNHYKKLCQFLIKKYHIKNQDTILDIGCNDGILLNQYPKKFLNLLGVEPSNACKFIKDKRIKLFNNFFSKEVAIKIHNKFNKAKVITMTNVLAHVHNVNDLVSNIKFLLDKKGIFVIEVPYLFDMLNKGLFDVIYHEHLSYFSIHSLNNLFERNGLKIIYYKQINFGASGPAIRVIATHKNKNLSKLMQKKLLIEKKNGIHVLKTYLNFSEKTKIITKKLRDRIIDLVLNKKNKIACYTAPAKGNTLLNSLNLPKNLISYVSENNKKKIGKYTPGTHIKIVSDDFLIKKRIKYALLLSWNYKKFFLKKSLFIKKGGSFLIPF